MPAPTSHDAKELIRQFSIFNRQLKDIAGVLEALNTNVVALGKIVKEANSSNGRVSNKEIVPGTGEAGSSDSTESSENESRVRSDDQSPDRYSHRAPEGRI